MAIFDESRAIVTNEFKQSWTKVGDVWVSPKAPNWTIELIVPGYWMTRYIVPRSKVVIPKRWDTLDDALHYIQAKQDAMDATRARLSNTNKILDVNIDKPEVPGHYGDF